MSREVIEQETSAEVSWVPVTKEDIARLATSHRAGRDIAERASDVTLTREVELAAIARLQAAALLKLGRQLDPFATRHWPQPLPRLRCMRLAATTISIQRSYWPMRSHTRPCEGSKLGSARGRFRGNGCVAVQSGSEPLLSELVDLASQCLALCLMPASSSDFSMIQRR